MEYNKKQNTDLIRKRCITICMIQIEDGIDKIYWKLVSSPLCRSLYWSSWGLKQTDVLNTAI